MYDKQMHQITHLITGKITPFIHLPVSQSKNLSQLCSKASCFCVKDKCAERPPNDIEHQKVKGIPYSYDNYTQIQISITSPLWTGILELQASSRQVNRMNPMWIRKYFLKAPDFHRPICCIWPSDTPWVAAKVAAPMRKLWPV